MNLNGIFTSVLTFSSSLLSGTLYNTMSTSILGLSSFATFPELAEAQSNTECLVNTYKLNDQTFPRIASLTTGEWVVTWESGGQDGYGWGSYAQWYASNGVMQGSEFRINDYTHMHQVLPTIAPLMNGGCIFAWASDQDSSAWDIFGKRYNADRSQSSTEFKVQSTNTTADYAWPTVAGLSNGGSVFAWYGDPKGTASFDIFAKLYFANGTQHKDTFQVNTYTSSDQSKSTVAALNNDKYIIAWHSAGQDGSGYGVYAQILDFNAGKIGSEFRVNTHVISDQVYPSVASFSNEYAIITWTSYGQDQSGGYGIFAQTIDSSGSKIGTEFQVNTYTAGDQLLSNVATLTGNRFVIAWQSNGQDGSGYGVYAQMFHFNRTKIGSELQVNTYTTGDQTYPGIAAHPDGGFLITWMSAGQINGGDIFIQRFDTNGNKINLALTDSPTAQPTQPSGQPSGEPTGKPSGQPTRRPSRYPTGIPTGYPSAYPSGYPTSMPSRWPTSHPSHYPTGVPTGYPSAYPSGYPTSIPSRWPTSHPSIAPTFSPTEHPSIAPTLQPTYHPTFHPSIAPTLTPSLFPTRLPTRVPSASPTKIGETNRPTKYPTLNPTELPTGNPTGSPTTEFFANWTRIDGKKNTQLSAVGFIENYQNIFSIVNNINSSPTAIVTIYNKAMETCDAFYLPWEKNYAITTQGDYECFGGVASNGFSVVGCVELPEIQQFKWSKEFQWSFFTLVSLNFNAAKNLEFVLLSTTYSDTGNIIIGEFDPSSGEFLSVYSYVSKRQAPHISVIPEYSVPCEGNPWTYVTGMSSEDYFHSIFVLLAKKYPASANFYRLASRNPVRYDINQGLVFIHDNDENVDYVLDYHTRNRGSKKKYGISQLKYTEQNSITPTLSWSEETDMIINDMALIKKNNEGAIFICGSYSNFPDKLNIQQLVIIKVINGNFVMGKRIISSNHLQCQQIKKTSHGIRFTGNYYQDTQTWLLITGYFDQETFELSKLPYGFTSTSEGVLDNIQAQTSDLEVQLAINVSSGEGGVSEPQVFGGNSNLIPVDNFNQYYYIAPTLFPTIFPTFAPSRLPSRFPSFPPSLKPSSPPSFWPTRRPTTLRPTVYPTISLQPTPVGFTWPPTGEPTGAPSPPPSAKPTGKPTKNPTGIPSGEPTTKPTGKPTKFSSQIPTRIPSKASSPRPSLSPTKHPSRLTVKPSTQFPTTTQPTGEPTGLPTLFFISEDKSQWTDIFTKHIGAWSFGAVSFGIIVVFLLETGAHKKLQAKIAILFKKRISPAHDIENNITEEKIETTIDILEKIYATLIERDITIEYICKKINNDEIQKDLTEDDLLREIDILMKIDNFNKDDTCKKIDSLLQEKNFDKNKKLNKILDMFLFLTNETIKKTSEIKPKKEESMDDFFKKILKISADYLSEKKLISNAIFKKILSKNEKNDFFEKKGIIKTKNKHRKKKKSKIFPKENLLKQKDEVKISEVKSANATEKSAHTSDNAPSNSSTAVPEIFIKKTLVEKEENWELSSESSEEEPFSNIPRDEDYNALSSYDSNDSISQWSIGSTISILSSAVFENFPGIFTSLSDQRGEVSESELSDSNKSNNDSLPDEHYETTESDIGRSQAFLRDTSDVSLAVSDNSSSFFYRSNYTKDINLEKTINLTTSPIPFSGV